MKNMLLAALAVGTALAGVSSADAAGGCGPGGHRGPYGGCRPNGPRFVGPPVVGTYYPGQGYWYRNHYWHNRYRWHGGWRYR